MSVRDGGHQKLNRICPEKKDKASEKECRSHRELETELKNEVKQQNHGGRVWSLSCASFHSHFSIIQRNDGTKRDGPSCYYWPVATQIR
jgi:hypothetical protein